MAVFLSYLVMHAPDVLQFETKTLTAPRHVHSKVVLLLCRLLALLEPFPLVHYVLLVVLVDAGYVLGQEKGAFVKATILVGCLSNISAVNTQGKELLLLFLCIAAYMVACAAKQHVPALCRKLMDKLQRLNKL